MRYLLFDRCSVNGLEPPHLLAQHVTGYASSLQRFQRDAANPLCQRSRTVSGVGATARERETSHPLHQSPEAHDCGDAVMSLAAWGRLAQAHHPCYHYPHIDKSYLRNHGVKILLKEYLLYTDILIFIYILYIFTIYKIFTSNMYFIRLVKYFHLISSQRSQSSPPTLLSSPSPTNLPVCECSLALPGSRFGLGLDDHYSPPAVSAGQWQRVRL